ncbi:MAG: hypothetical protein HZB25_14225 [Candidatus Eisenbacteria bacterium]|nr:hypothetical protein [Candidatus Eisenbacteria bacterium]
MIELVMVIVILGVVAAGVATAFRAATDMAATQAALAAETAESRRVMATLVSEIRLVDGGVSFAQWSAQDCGFDTVRGDSVRFTWSGTPGAPLLAKYDTQVDTLSRSVDSLAFAYLDTLRNPAASADRISTVSVYLRLSRSGAQLAQRNVVYVRN